MVRKYINIPVLFLLLKKKKTPNLVCLICMYSISVALNLSGDILSPWGHLALSGEIFDHHNSREGRRVLLPTILPQLGQPPQQRVIWPHVWIGTGEKPAQFNQVFEVLGHLPLSPFFPLFLHLSCSPFLSSSLFSFSVKLNIYIQDFKKTNHLK